MITLAAIHIIAERRIEEAIKEGKLHNRNSYLKETEIKCRN